MPQFELNRRQFLTGAGSLFFSSLTGQSKANVTNSDAILASCIKRKDGRYGAVLFQREP